MKVPISKAVYDELSEANFPGLSIVQTEPEYYVEYPEPVTIGDLDMYEVESDYDHEAFWNSILDEPMESAPTRPDLDAEGCGRAPRGSMGSTRNPTDLIALAPDWEDHIEGLSDIQQHCLELMLPRLQSDYQYASREYLRLVRENNTMDFKPHVVSSHIGSLFTKGILTISPFKGFIKPKPVPQTKTDDLFLV